jgi:RNA polymerase sigma factor (sigma-70 family)
MEPIGPVVRRGGVSTPPAGVDRAAPGEAATSIWSDALYVAEYEAMVRVAFLIVGSRADAEDVAQDAFARVHLRGDRVDRPGAYLRRCVVNGALDVLRRRRTLADRVRALRAEDSTVLGADELSDALAALPDRQRAALVLRFYQGLSEREVAEALGVRPGTAKSLVHRGLANLREVIER